MDVKCPHCGIEVDWKLSAFRPFCSEKCKLSDLGKWATETYRIPVQESPAPAPMGQKKPNDEEK